MWGIALRNRLGYRMKKGDMDDPLGLWLFPPRTRKKYRVPAIFILHNFGKLCAIIISNNFVVWDEVLNQIYIILRNALTTGRFNRKTRFRICVNKDSRLYGLVTPGTKRAWAPTLCLPRFNKYGKVVDWISREYQSFLLTERWPMNGHWLFDNPSVDNEMKGSGICPWLWVVAYLTRSWGSLTRHNN